MPLPHFPPVPAAFCVLFQVSYPPRYLPKQLLPLSTAAALRPHDLRLPRSCAALPVSPHPPGAPHIPPSLPPPPGVPVRPPITAPAPGAPHVPTPQLPDLPVPAHNRHMNSQFSCRCKCDYLCVNDTAATQPGLKMLLFAYIFKFYK